jgi:hypothetical protein
MDITTKKPSKLVPSFINDLIKSLKIENIKIDLLGTASLESQYYYSDFDLYSDISKIKDLTTVYKNLDRIFDLKDNNVYFKEFKIQFINGEKIKYYELPISINKNIKRDDVDYFKIDYIVFVDNQFTDVSLIYNLNPLKKSKEEIIELIRKDQKEFYDMGKTYKSLKRYFSILNLQGKKADMVKLTIGLFNTENGRQYKICSVLGTIIDLIKQYGRNYKDVSKKIKANLKLFKLPLNMTIKQMNEYIKEHSDIFNKEALTFYKKLKIKI